MTAITQEQVKLRVELVAWKPYKEGWGFGEAEIVGAKKAASSKPKSGGGFNFDGDDGTIRFTGTLVGVRVGDTVDLVGVWTSSDRYGKQLKVRECTVVRIEGPEGAVKWLESRFPGIGATRAKEMVDKFGAELWNVFEHESHRLAQIKGITPSMAEKIGAVYREVAHERDHMIKLRGWGLTDNQVNRCKEQWGSLEKVISKLRQNPYLLSQHVHGFGFLRSDEIALKMGVPKDSPERIQAGVEYQLDEAAGDGHCFVWGGKLQAMSAQMLGVDPQLVVGGIKTLCKAGRIVRRGARCYAAGMDLAERDLAKGLGKLLLESRGRDGRGDPIPLRTTEIPG